MSAGKIILIASFFLQTPYMEAQHINWDNINLASAEAKMLAITNSGAEQTNSLIILAFDTKEGKISVYLPPLSFSVTISGRVYLEPTGKDSSRNLAALQLYRLSVGDVIIPVQRGSFTLTLPGGLNSETIPLQLKNTEGQVIKTESLSVTKTSANSTGFLIPPYIVSGNATSVRGIFDGNMVNTSLTINEEKAALLAESPSQLYFTTTASQTGPATVMCTENGKTQTSISNLLKLDLTADKTNLRRGQQTQIHIQISGLEGLKENVPVTITNTSPSVITLEGGNTQQLTIVPSKNAAAGVFTISRNIHSIKNGGFSVSVTVSPFSPAIH